MRRVNSLAAPPPRLAAYREEKPDVHDWETFRNEERGGYQELLEALVRNQNNLCCYCEIDLIENDQSIEHFLPKSDERYAHLALAVENLMASCGGGSLPHYFDPEDERIRTPDPDRFRRPLPDNLSCDRRKADDSPEDKAILDPTELPLATPVYVVASLSGKLSVHGEGCLRSEIDVSIAAQTIDLLGLNCPRLVEARRDHFRALEEEYDTVDDPALRLAFARAVLTPDGDGRLERFFTTNRSYFQIEANLLFEAESSASE